MKHEFEDSECTNRALIAVGHGPDFVCLFAGFDREGLDDGVLGQ